MRARLQGRGQPVVDGGLSEVRAHPMTDGEIRKILGNDIKIITSRELVNIRKVDDLFDKQGRCVLLYTPHDPTSGHWVCLMHKGDCIHYFDSYGDKADIPEDLGDVPPYLTEILKQSGLPVYYNTHQYQKEREDFATCGRWCVARLLYKDKTPEQFHAIVKKFKGQPDDFVSGLIYSFIKT